MLQFSISVGNNIQDTKEQFYRIGEFPGAIGGIDCTHVPIKSPRGDNAEIYRNRKGWMSLNVQIVCGPKMQIFDIVCRWPGSVHDSRIYNNSRVKLLIESNALAGHLIGDSGYPQSKFLYTPKLNPSTAAENKYNKSHIKTRNVIERVKGVPTQKSISLFMQKAPYKTSNFNFDHRFMCYTS
ncbi:PREDICTED: putative nuclease HARBI1 [Diuraphis noxia]|uniref:putative nuclease HARBI1 n=1 Tax=Diuraphis noxia TaxID=143948 RepID=UPI000763942C|nr:PREDICTED: putative nuclease HARBI1 [Diuraphis noxia]